MLPMKMKPTIEKMLMQNKECLGSWWKHLSANPAATSVLIENQNQIDWCYLCKNTHPLIIESVKVAIRLYDEDFLPISWIFLSENSEAIELLYLYSERISWVALCENKSPLAIELLKTNMSHIYWATLSENPFALELLQTYPELIDWGRLSVNPAAIDLLESNMDKIRWDNLSVNSSALHLLEQNPTKIDWYNLCKNPSSRALELLDKNPENISWFALTFNTNPDVIYLFEKYFTKYANDGVIISNLLEQPYIFEYDYVKMKLNMDTLREELIQKTMHPSRVCKIIEEGYDEML
jgi:hypothetical protein